MTRLALFLAAGISAVAFSSASFSADLIIEEPEAGVVEVSGNWEGPYLGIYLGYGWGSATEHDYLSGDDYDYDLAGWIAGATLGANFAVTDGIVAGVAADLSWSGIREDDFDFLDVEWTGALRGKVGIDAGQFMPYLTAGLAVAGVTFDTEYQTHFGWTAGGGIEVAVEDDTSVDLGYRFSDYGAVDYFDNGDTMEFSTHQVTIGVNMQF